MADKHEEHELPRVLTASHATSIVVGIIIGSGIFLVPREMMAAVGSPGTVYAVWIVGGLLSLFGAMTYAEIAAGRPKYGGEYAFLRDAYGDLTAFVFMWTQVTIAKPSSIASIASGVVRVLGNFNAFSFLSLPFAPHVVYGQLVAIAFVWLITGLNILGTRRAGNAQRVLMGLKVAMVLAVVGLCIAGGQGTVANFSTHYTAARGGFAGFMIALIAALWAYDGWSDVTHAAGEIQNPRRSLPFALVGGVTIVGVLYMLTNAAIQYVLPATTIANSDRPAVAAILLSVGPAAAWLFSIGLAISYGSTFIGSSLTGARIPFAAASRRPLLPRPRLRSSTLQDAVESAHPASDPLLHPAVAHQHISGTLLAGHLFGVALLRRRHRVGLRLSPPRDAHRARKPPLQRVGLPRRACTLHRRRRGAAGLFDQRPTTQLPHRQRHNSVRHSALLHHEQATRLTAVLNHPLIHAHILMRRLLPREVLRHAAPHHACPLILIPKGAQRPLQRA